MAQDSSTDDRIRKRTQILLVLKDLFLLDWQIHLRQTLYMECIEGENLTGNNLTQKEKNEIYKKVVGMSKQGRVFGLGSVQSEVYISPDGPSNLPPTSNEVDILTRRIGEMDTELKKAKKKICF